MPAISKAQQRFFGMVRATQKGEMENPSPEVTKAASSMSKSDVKKFAKTKHKELPEKKLSKEAYYGGEEQRKKDERKAAYEKQLKKMLPKRAFDSMGRELDPRSGKLKEKVEEESNPRIPRKKGQPANSKKHSDLYTDENPKGTIHGLGFKDVATAKASVSKIRNSSRSHAHKIQAAVAMEQRAREMGKTSEAAVYRKFINSMKEKTKKMNEQKENGKCKVGQYYCYTDKKCKPIPKGFMVDPEGMLRKENGHSVSEEIKHDRYVTEKKKTFKEFMENI